MDGWIGSKRASKIEVLVGFRRLGKLQIPVFAQPSIRML